MEVSRMVGEGTGCGQMRQVSTWTDVTGKKKKRENGGARDVRDTYRD